jgi:predicted MFS family arabinose efflux permease
VQIPGTPAEPARPNAISIALAALVALALAMGVGRFAFTPIMPIMEADAGLTLKAAGWLAASNYLGYLLGALCAARLKMATAVRGGLLLTAVVTFAMGLTHVFAVQMALRLIAGVASAWVLIHVSAWSLGRLLALGRAKAIGIVYAGVGVGVAAAGLVCMATMHIRLDSARTWQLFGVLSLAVTLLLWRSFPSGQSSLGRRSHARAIHWTRDKWRLMLCYGALGIGYIIPATYLPSMAHRYIQDPAIFGLAWPVFGAASAVSTLIAAYWFARFNDRKLWSVCHVLMTAGVALPALWPTLTSILIAALLVGGTYMVATMFALRETTRTAGVQATFFLAAMTVAFAIGQIAGPLLVSAIAHLPHGFAAALLVSAVLLLLSAGSLWRSAGVQRA